MLICVVAFTRDPFHIRIMQHLPTGRKVAPALRITTREAWRRWIVLVSTRRDSAQPCRPTATPAAFRPCRPPTLRDITTNEKPYARSFMAFYCIDNTFPKQPKPTQNGSADTFPHAAITADCSPDKRLSIRFS